jgi:hypothetical protein
MKVTMKFWVLVILLSIFSFASGQHDHHQAQSDTSKTKTKNTRKEMKRDTSNHNSGAMPGMSHAFSLNLPMTRNGSGTGWLPDSTPMYGYMFHTKKWMFMGHGNVFLRYTNQDIFNVGSRGGDKFDAINWFMFMGQRKVGQWGMFRFSSMLSLDALFGNNGYPLLFQTGESYKDAPLVDRQHPHDLFSELSIAYTHAINRKTDVFVYAGYPGEPALGSVAFMHRVSALYMPDAPLSHHWNDGTHITFGVVTAGIRLGKFKIEGSSFTGREPGENRYDFDRPRFDSYCGRLSFNPNSNWALQVSQGFVKSPEAVRPGEDVNRTTVSAVYSKPINLSSYFNGTALWGLNRSHSDENAGLLEGVLVLNRMAIFGRYEYVEKSSEELNLNYADYEHDAQFGVNALTLGLSYDLVKSEALNLAFGAQGTVYLADTRLENLYGKNPVSGELFIRLYPPRMR